MQRVVTRMRLFMLVGLALSLTVAAEVQRAESSEVNPAATEILKRMTDHLGSLKRFSVETQNTFEDLLVSGHRVDSEISANVIVSRPDKLRAERKGDHVDQIFYYDGRTLTLYNPTDKVYAMVSVPATFEEMFTFIYESLGFGVPVSDLVYSDAFSLLMEDVYFSAGSVRRLSTVWSAAICSSAAHFTFAPPEGSAGHLFYAVHGPAFDT